MKPVSGLSINRITTVFTVGALVWCGLVLVLLDKYPRLMAPLNFKLYDWKLSLSPETGKSNEIVHVDVDDKAVNTYGQWPWDRSMSAKMVERLSQFGAKLIVFDIIYAGEGKSREGNEAFFKAIKDAGNVVSATGIGLGTQETKQDKRRNEEQDEKLVIEGGKERADAIYDRSWSIGSINSPKLPRVTSLGKAFLPLVPVIVNSTGIGQVNGVPDPDGVYRRIPILVRLVDRFVPSLSLSSLKGYLDFDIKDLSFGAGREIIVRHGNKTIRIPLDEKGMMPVRWGHPWATFEHWPATDILSEEVDRNRESRYKGKIVIIGVTWTAKTDMGPTPLDTAVPLSRIHSFALNTMLSGNFITPVRATPYILGLGIIAAILFPLTIMRASLRIAIILAIVVFIGSFVISIGLFIVAGYEVPIGEFLLAVTPCMAGVIVTRAFAVEMKAIKTSKTLERYLSPDLVTQVLRDGEELDLTSKRKELSIVFVDIEGFSSTCETVDVEYINQFLNNFFEQTVGAIFQYKGTIDKFLGDGLLAFFGDPVSIDNSALSAVNAGMEMQRRMKQLNSKWSRSGIQEFEKGVRIRIGINTGPVVVGNIGFSQRVEYTVLGSVVNVASRLQALAPPGGIIMTARTYALVKDQIQCRGPDPVRVKGIDRDIATYKIYSEDI